MVRLEITLQADEADLVVKAIEQARDAELRVQALASTCSSDRDCKRTAGGFTAEDKTGRSSEADVFAREATSVGASAETPAVASAAAELRDRRSHKVPSLRRQTIRSWSSMAPHV